MICSVVDCKHTTLVFIKGMCFNHYQKDYEDTHPEYKEKKRRTSKAWALYNKDRAANLHERPKNRFRNFINCAKRRNKEVTISFEEWTSLVMDKFCHYCQGKLPLKGSALDRKDSSGSYNVENVVPCCTSCNSIRGADNITYEEMLYIMPLLKAFRNKI